MLFIVVTPPQIYDGEAEFISRLLGNGVDMIHLRKPDASLSACANLLDRLTDEERSHIVIHDFFELAATYSLHGIHLNSRHNAVPTDYVRHVSRSCHSLDEVATYKNSCNYVFLSPIFDSVSKQWYTAAFDDDELHRASAEDIIDSKVVALGGVTPSRVPYLRSLGFGGAAMLGCVSRLVSLPPEEQIHTIREIRNIFNDNR